jgi:hypothetical protein
MFGTIIRLPGGSYITMGMSKYTMISQIIESPYILDMISNILPTK